MNVCDIHWLVGLMEGEGTFMAGSPSQPNSPTAVLAMTDEDIVARAAVMFGVNYSKVNPRKAHWKPVYRVVITGSRAVEWMTTLKPFMGRRRQDQIMKALATYRDKSTPRVLSNVQVRQIRGLRDAGLTCRQIARKDFGVSHVTIYKVMQGKTYRDVL